MLGRSVLAILGGVAVALVVAVGICEWLGWPFLRGPIERTIEARIHRDVSFGQDFRLSLFGGLRLSSDRFAIGPPAEGPEGSPEEFVHASDVELRLPYATVLGPLRGVEEPLRVTSLTVTQLNLNLWRGPDGKANWQFGAGDSTGERVVFPQFDRLVVREGHVRIDDARADVHAVAAVSTDEGTAAGDKGGLKVSARGTYQDRPLRVQLTSTGLLPLAQSTAQTPPLPVTLKAQAGGAKLDFEGEAADVLKLESLKGRFALSGPTLAAVGDAVGLTLPNTPPFDMTGKVRKSGVVWEADIEAFDTGKSQLAGEFTYDPQPSPPLLSGRLRGDRLVLTDLAPAIGAAPGDARNGNAKNGNAKKADAGNGSARNADGKSAKAAGKPLARGSPPAKGTPQAAAARDVRAKDDAVLPARPFDLPSLRAMNASVEIDLKRLDLPTDRLRSIAPVRGKLTLDDGLLAIDRLAAHTADGQLRGALSLDSRKQPPLWSADIGWSAVDLAKWITARNESAGEGEPDEYLTGKLSGQAKLQGSGRSTAAILGSLDGSLYTWIRDGTISHLLVEALGLDIAQGVGLLAVGDDPLPLYCAVAQLKASNGLVHTELGILDTPDSTIFVNGEVSLAHEQLALVLTAKPKDFSPLTVRAPVRITGRFADPQVKPDAKTLGAKLAAAAVLAAINPLAALIPLMDPADPAARRCADVVRSTRGPESRPKPGARAAPRSAEEARKPVQ